MNQHSQLDYKFVATEPLGKSGQKGERQVWETVKKVFAQRECLAYWRYPIFCEFRKVRKEPDILIADIELGLIVIEVKSITIDQIFAINGHRWELRNFYTNSSNPYEQAENQLFGLLGYCDREPNLRSQVSGRVIVALPFISQQQWQNKGFAKLPSCPPLLFQENLFLETENPTFFEKIRQTSPIIKGRKLNPEQWKLLLSVLGGNPVFRQRKNLTPSVPLSVDGEGEVRGVFPRISLNKEKEIKSAFLPLSVYGEGVGGRGSRASILEQVRQNLSEFDLQQENIGKQIPPGMQRIRGIAGSGKTVLLCQKAANMHLKYPEWDIALVFFTRSLYEQIITQIDKWIRRFSHNEVQYNPNNEKLRVLHAWGAKNQPGLYSVICEAANAPRLTVFDTENKQPNESLAEVCSFLLEKSSIPQIFDAILIDEGQDLIVDDEFKFQDKQPFYWMAYQALRPFDEHHPEQRRLIWAYDEAQSLDCLNIPTAGELFGDELAHLVTGQYPDGIKKTEIIHRCYRTPEPIVTAAHAMSMGLLRRGGMVSGITRTEDWKALGYEVQGRFTRGQQVTLKRFTQDSPNIITKLWEKPVLEFETYPSRQAELRGLADSIIEVVLCDRLQPSKEILVIVLGSFFEAMQLENHVAEFLMSEGIDIFIPGTTDCNILKADSENSDPNKFWCEGGVTVSRIHRAKGNEADMVYVVGLDNIAKDESNIRLRNQLFIALTRTRAWVKLSGVGNYQMYEEMRRVIASGDTFTFTFNHRPKREISVTDAGELLKRYAAGGRNFQNADLRGIQLAGANLRGANLISAKLNNASLSNAKLDSAKLVIADLSNADLSNASLRKAKLMGAILRDANLSGVDLSRADLSDADLRNAKLVGANLLGANLNAVDLTNADLTGANIEGVELGDMSLLG
ncbi:DNA/RNA helicase [[Phormidium ambiguum] IAM M-71]|uniref:DNA/RNA helicase n=1 Tax=[Phormidium ambiguum] IAM M-71 TaxID=454136 RepID=A0A1U7I1K6_9CYAN|nr:pentapeptide repeat-containing protein [Phormidium ambiguum]OKH29865.1 DNA/RNA helicase [Phormidium ambiguum IAM M-71]